MRVKIYSNEHNAWWKANYCGYTNDESKAGIFEIEEVNKKYPYIDFNKSKEDYLVKFEGLTYKELENENELLKEIIRSFFDRGCPMNNNSYFDFIQEKEKNREDKDNIYCTGISDREFVNFAIKYLLGDNWYVTDPLGNSQVNQVALEEILSKYSKSFRKELSDYKKEMLENE